MKKLFYVVLVLACAVILIGAKYPFFLLTNGPSTSSGRNLAIDGSSINFLEIDGAGNRLNIDGG